MVLPGSVKLFFYPMNLLDKLFCLRHRNATAEKFSFYKISDKLISMNFTKTSTELIGYSCEAIRAYRSPKHSKMFFELYEKAF